MTTDTTQLSATSTSRVATPPLWLLALITFSGTLAMHIFVPVLPLAATGLSASPSEMQLTISIYIFGLAIGQLVYGPLSDRFGRRPILMGGLVVYTLASVAAVLAPDVDTLIGIRLFQALGGCTGMVVGRAVVRDTSSLTEATRRMALLNLMVAIGPGFAPLLGSTLGTLTGWRSIFVFLSLLGMLNFICAIRMLPETAPRQVGNGAAVVLRNYAKLISTPAFLGYTIGGGCATTSFYAFVSSAPFIFVSQLHRPDHEIGIYLGIIVLGYWIGSFITSRIAGRVPVRRLLLCNLVSFAAAVVLLVLALSGNLSVILVVGLMFVYTVGAGIASPAALAEAVSVNPQVAGSASGLYGCSQMLVGAIASAAAGFGSDHAVAAAGTVVVAGIIAQACFWIADRSPR